MIHIVSDLSVLSFFYECFMIKPKYLIKKLVNKLKDGWLIKED